MLLMREEGFRYAEIAEAVGVAPGSVGTLLARALRRFSTALEPSSSVGDAEAAPGSD
jgi:RNA polymerase sigma-70 factor (ECF subfamily)